MDEHHQTLDHFREIDAAVVKSKPASAELMEAARKVVDIRDSRSAWEPLRRAIDELAAVLGKYEREVR